IAPPPRPGARKRGDHGPELRAALGARQRQPQRLEVAADGLQLAHDRLRAVVAQPAVAPGAGARERAGVGRASPPSRTGAGSRIAAAIARASARSRAPRSARANATGAPARL